MDLTLQTGLAVLEVIWVNILLSGDNAVVIAMACRGLQSKQRRLGLVLGAGVAVLLRIVFTVIVAKLLATPFLRIVGSLLLLWVAVKLIAEEADDENEVKASDRLLSAIWTIAVADMVMSLDNVLAIAAIAKDSTALMVLGLVISIPLIVAGATLIMALLARFPVLVWAGAGLLGWVAGEMLDTDPYLVEKFGEVQLKHLEIPFAIAGAAIVLVTGFVMKRRAEAAHP